MVEPGTVTTGWSLKAIWTWLREFWSRGRKLAALPEDVATLREQVADL